MPKRFKNKPIKKWSSSAPPAKDGCLRIIGGRLRGRQIDYSGDPRTRPMKDNVREALFNVVGAHIEGKVAFDLFAGTGAIGLEAISRGALRSIFIERHVPSSRIISKNAEQLGVSDQIEVVSATTFFWFRQFAKEGTERPQEPWAVFCSPPYSFFLERSDEMLELIQAAVDLAPPGSFVVVESDSRFALRKLPRADQWRTRNYTPAIVSVIYLNDEEDSQQVDEE